MSPGRYAMSAAHRVPSPCRSKPEGFWSAPPVGRDNPGQAALPPPRGIAGLYSSFQLSGGLALGMESPPWCCCTIGPVT